MRARAHTYTHTHIDTQTHMHTHAQGTARDEPPVVLVRAERNVFMLNGDIMDIADRATKDFIPTAKDDGKVGGWFSWQLCMC